MPGLSIGPALESGTLRASATFQEPLVQRREDDALSPRLLIEEGGVAVELEFPDLGSLRRFLRRLAALLPNRPRR